MARVVVGRRVAVHVAPRCWLFDRSRRLCIAWRVRISIAGSRRIVLMAGAVVTVVVGVRHVRTGGARSDDANVVRRPNLACTCRAGV